MTQQARRLRARLAALGAVGATALAAAGVQGAAHAAEAPLPVVITGEDRVDLSLHSDNGDPTEPQVDLRIDVPGEEFEGDGEVPSVHRGEYTIRIDARGLKGVAKADLPCEADGLVAVCTGYDLYAGTTFNRVGGIRLDLSDDSEAGDTGKIVVTGEGEGLDFTPLTVDVRVGGPELLNRELSAPDGLKAGDDFELPLGVMNVGGLPAEGTVLRLLGSRGLSFPDAYGNCSSSEINTGDLLRQRTEVLCTFPGTLDAGAAYRLSRQVRVQTADFALNDIFSYSFDPLEPGEEKKIHRGEGRRQGSGPDLTLERVADADPARYTKYAELDLPRTNTYDLELTGASASGEAGEKVEVEIGFRNNGPAWIGGLRSGGEPFTFTVAPPAGATFTRTPERCTPAGVNGSDPAYLCFAPTPMLEDARLTFPFELRVDRVVEGAKGRVALPDWDNPYDSDPANDVAWIVLNAAEEPGDDGTGGSDGGPSDDPTAPGSGDGDGSGGDAVDEGTGSASGGGSGDDADGGLALTGAQGVGLLGGAAALALGLGAAVVTYQRRRAGRDGEAAV
ncbi:hypothetical protein ABT368_03675 [Streptomyces althioticus]|uniref:hypothetical protein n=1 Tax=Streptomyces TaxID=1883 RepID=UPI0018740B28|nr:hypothetical protein GCM10010243_07400 [Streptomyces matensis]